MLHKVQVIYEVEVEGSPEADPKVIAATARNLIENTDYGDTCSYVRVFVTPKELKDA
jgi:hypothetical protein